MWNAVTYFATLASSLKLTKAKYKFCRVTGLNYLEDLLAGMNSSDAFFAVDDSDDGMTIRNGGGYFNRRAIVVYILKKYKFGDQSARETVLNETREIRRQLITRLLKDSGTVDGLTFLDKSRIPYHEVPGYFAAGTAGIYFIITIDEPTDLVYNGDEWE